MPRTPQEVLAVVEPLVHELGVEVVDCEVKGPDKKRFIRVLIHKSGGVTAADCRILAKRLQNTFDEQEFFFPGFYRLEVASPGLDRPLKNARDFARNAGQKVRVFLSEPYEGKVELVGRIGEVLEDRLRLALENGAGALDLNLAQINRGKLVIEF